jgi:hypothetical protein
MSWDGELHEQEYPVLEELSAFSSLDHPFPMDDKNRISFI